MAKKFLSNIDLAKNQIINVLLHSVAGDAGTPSEAQIWYNSSTKKFRGRTDSATVTFVNDGGDLSNGSVALAKLASDPLARSAHTGTQSASTISDFNTAVRTNRLDQMAAPTASVVMNSQKITGLLAPTAATDAATKGYVDDAVAGLSWKEAVRVATTANITLSATQTIDGVALSVGDRVLVKNQSTASGNGLYVVASGAWTRATDGDTQDELRGMAVMVEEGTTQVHSQWVLTTDGTITVGTTNLAYVQFGGGQTYTAGNGLTLSGNDFNVGAGTGISVGADTVAIDTAVVARKYAASVGNGSLTSISITHSLGTRDVTVNVYDNATYETVECDVVRTDTNTVTVSFAVAPSSNAYRVCVTG